MIPRLFLEHFWKCIFPFENPKILDGQTIQIDGLTERNVGLNVCQAPPYPYTWKNFSV